VLLHLAVLSLPGSRKKSMLMGIRNYGERDYAFGQLMITLRTTLGLTQAGLAEFLHVSRRAVGDWETGNSYPKAEHLKVFIGLCVKHRALPAGREVEEIRGLWKAAHQKVLLDERWLSTLFDQSNPPLASLAPQSVKDTRPLEPPTTQSVKGTRPLEPPVTLSTATPRIDWGDAQAVPTFYGREQELAQLAQWIVQERCRVISLLGMGGIGKSTLSVNLIHQVAEHFEFVIFRSLRDAPSCETLLDDCLQVLSPELLSAVPASLERRISLLIERFRKVRVLLVLDNLESLLEEGDIKGRFLPGFEGYGMLLRRVAETMHQSCLLLTSREKPGELRAMEGKYAPVHSLRLSGLDVAACEQLFAEKDVIGTLQDWAHLIEVYAGNPLALKIVAETIADLFGGEIGQFLSGGTMIFGSISDLLSEQFARLSAMEQTILRWLAIAREPVTIDELQAMLVAPPPRVQMLEAIDSLRRRSLIERGQRLASFTLQAVVLEYITTVLITEVTNEIRQRQLHRFIEHGLEQANAKEYVRQTQQRLIVAPILAQLYSSYHGRGEIDEQLLSLLHQLHERAEYAQGYGPANLIALLRQHRGHLEGVDLSNLSIRGAYLQGVEMQDTSLAGAILRDTVFTEAFDAAWAVAISNNGKYWAAGSSQGEIRVWREGGQTLHLVWQAHTDNTYALAFSPDDHTLASGSWDGSVKLWNLEDGALLWTGWHTDMIRSVAFSPDGQTLASAGDVVIQLWKVTSGTNVQTLPHPDPICSMAWSPDGSMLASSSFDGSIRLWQLQETQPAACVKILTGHTNWVFALAFAPDGTQLASGSWDGTVKLWEVASGLECQTLTGHTERVYTLAWSPDGRTLASTGFDDTIWLWDVERSSYRVALHGHKAVIYSLAFTPDSRSLLSSSEDGTLRVWNVGSGQCMHIMQGYTVSFYDVALSPDNTRLASGGSDMLVIIWDMVGKTRPRVLRGHSWTVFGVAWSPDGRLLASSGRDNAIRLWDPDTGICLHTFRDPDYVDTIFYDVAWSPDGRLLACGSYMRGVHVWNVERHTHRWVGRAHQTRIRCVAWSPDGTRLASCGDDGSVCLWDSADGTLLVRLSEHSGRVGSVSWSPDSSQLASGGGGRGEGELFVWDAQSGERIQTLSGHPDSILAVAWSKRGDLLVSGGSDGRIRWWKVQSGECLRTCEGHQGVIHSLKISHDGRLLASSGDDSTIRLWDLESAELLQTLQRDRPYERLNITGTRGLTDAQKATLRALGAIEENGG
jgi:WD40 repeat protein/DNA-binding XRE family transcriptional regulator